MLARHCRSRPSARATPVVQQFMQASVQRVQSLPQQIKPWVQQYCPDSVASSVLAALHRAQAWSPAFPAGRHRPPSPCGRRPNRRPALRLRQHRGLSPCRDPQQPPKPGLHRFPQAASPIQSLPRQTRPGVQHYSSDRVGAQSLPPVRSSRPSPASRNSCSTAFLIRCGLSMVITRSSRALARPSAKLRTIAFTRSTLGEFIDSMS